MQNKLMRFLLFFLIFLLVFQFFGKKEQGTPGDDIELLTKKRFSVGAEVQVQVKNHRESQLTIPLPCPQNPLLVERYLNGEWKTIEALIDPNECLSNSMTIEPGKMGLVQFGRWNHTLFKESGRFRVSLLTELDSTEKKYSREFEVKEPGFFRWIWNNLFYRPILNTLIYLISIIPGHGLGWGIILLTILIKVLLLGPNQKALKSQRAMQRLQPELDALKAKHAGDQQHLAQETMALWKKHKVSPLGSCLPLLIQFPVLIALFYVVRDGLTVVNPEVFYNALRTFDLHSINVYFLGSLNLTQKNFILLPVLVGGLQFLQMQLAFTKTAAPKTGDQNPLSAMNTTMKYMMPIMIAVFTASLPAAVGFYWGTSTLFGIGQQLVVNKMKD